MPIRAPHLFEAMLDLYEPQKTAAKRNDLANCPDFRSLEETLIADFSERKGIAAAMTHCDSITHESRDPITHVSRERITHVSTVFFSSKEDRMNRRFSLVSILAITLALGAAGSALATDEKPANAPAASAEQTQGEPMYVAGMQVSIDETTGELRPATAEEAANLAQQWRQMFVPRKTAPRAFTTKSGATAVELTPDMLKFTVVRIEADGSLTTGHANGQQEALEYIATTTTPEEE